MNKQELQLLESRLQTIKSEPNGIVRETMIDNLLVDMECEPHPLTDEEIEAVAENVIGKKFSEMSDDYRSWYHAFIQGYKHAMTANRSEWVRCEDVDEKYCECESPTLGTNLTRCGTCGEWFKPLPTKPTR